MAVVIGVRLREAGKLYHFDPGDLEVHRLDRVVVETQEGPEVGRVVTERQDRPAEALSAPLRRVLRKATAEDEATQRANRRRAEEALDVCRRKAAEHGLPMRLSDADCAFDSSRLTFYFTAEQRIDFRGLVRDLASTLHARIELRQIGARDEAKRLDGIGPCGQRLCCSRWLTDFKPISIKMAKLQNLALNPGKLAGMCGRLKCCLRYEAESYEEGAKQLPPTGAKVFTRDGEGRVLGGNPLERTVNVLVQDEPPARWYPVDEVFGSNGCGGGGEGGAGCSCGRGGSGDGG